MASTESLSAAQHAGNGSAALPRILVVDDSKVIRKSAQKMLGREFDVVTAEDGAEAWELLGIDAAIRVVFTDLAMPRLNGYELLRQIRSAPDHAIQSLPVIVVTGAEDAEVARVRALELGATDFITKPFTTIDLVARARAHATHQRVTEELRAQTTLDALTGLANKAGFLDHLQQDIAFARRHQQPLVLVRLDVGDFRELFLKHGKGAAERALVNLAHLLRGSIRKEDTAGRIGLGGFALSLLAAEQSGIERMVARVRAAVAQPSADVFALNLATAVLTVATDSGPTAQAALDACQALLDAARKNELAAAVPLGPTPVPTAAPLAAPTPTPPALRLDPLLDQIDRGQPAAAVEAMPQILRRLLPLLRLLNPTQRAQLLRFLQALGGT